MSERTPSNPSQFTQRASRRLQGGKVQFGGIVSSFALLLASFHNVPVAAAHATHVGQVGPVGIEGEDVRSGDDLSALVRSREAEARGRDLQVALDLALDVDRLRDIAVEEVAPLYPVRTADSSFLLLTT